LFSRIIRFYRLHLSRYLVFRAVRALLTILYRFCYQAYCQLKPTARVARFDLVRFGSYMGDHLVARFPVFSAQTTHIPGPFFLNDRNGAISATQRTVVIELPKIDVVELNDVAVVGGSDFILAGKAALVPDCFVEFADTCPANVFGVTAIDHSKQTLQLFITEQGIAIEAGISLLGQNTTNYAHWLTETLPKLAVLNAFSQYDDMPLLVDCGLHRNIYDSIGAVSGKQRQLIFVERWQSVRVRRLMCVSQPGYEPYIPHGLLNTGTPQIVNSFSIPALAALHAVALDTLPQPDPRNREKIFLCRSDRSNNLRDLTNSVDIEVLLRKKGYTLVDPTKLSFIEQVQACHAARIIVAPIGAALANMIFASAECQILALSPYYENANYYFYSNLAAVLKLRFSYLLGRQSDQRGHPMHRSYSVDPVLLERVLDSLIEH
jgi:capsular polysaccharide biosynthesis protein